MSCFLQVSKCSFGAKILIILQFFCWNIWIQSRHFLPCNCCVTRNFILKVTGTNFLQRELFFLEMFSKLRSFISIFIRTQINSRSIERQAPNFRKPLSGWARKYDIGISRESSTKNFSVLHAENFLRLGLNLKISPCKFILNYNIPKI